ncbi:MAG: NUDIX domain-containing protein [Patescibacteria group bacterium]
MLPREQKNLTPRLHERIADFFASLREPRVERARELRSEVRSINRWARREKIKKEEVSGLMALRINPDTGRREVLLVRGISDGVLKEFYQFPGGFLRRGEGPVTALHREIKEELGQSVPPRVSYERTFTPERKPGAKKALVVHAFKIEHCVWDIKDKVTSPENAVTLGSDVNEMVWTDKPFEHEDGTPRILTAQVDYMLRHYLGFVGPNNKNTPHVGHNGMPWHS